MADFLHRTWAEIDPQALLRNYAVIRRAAGTKKILAVVKANAYGHGAVPVARLLARQGCDGFAVSNIEEGEELRAAGITAPILILGYTPCALTARLAENRLEQVVYDTQSATGFSAAATRAGVTLCVHVKLDTGMGRLGFDFRSDDLPGLEQAKAVLSMPGLAVTGVFTHFALADETAGEAFTKAQTERFGRGVEALRQAGAVLTWIHCENSAGIFGGSPDVGNTCRPGIVLYGLSPSAECAAVQSGLIPVMTFKSVVSAVKTVKKGQPIGYGCTYTTPETRTVATVSVGYADGYPRLLSNQGYLLLHGQKAPILGRVCMDQCMVDVTGIEAVRPGDEAELFGKSLSAEQVAQWAQTVSYEIVCGVSHRVPRVTAEQ